MTSKTSRNQNKSKTKLQLYLIVLRASGLKATSAEAQGRATKTAST